MTLSEDMERCILDIANGLEEAVRSLREKVSELHRVTPHKSFDPGDRVIEIGTERAGIVEWVKNDACETPESTGVMGVNLLDGGSVTFTRRNNWRLMNDDEADGYFTPVWVEVCVPRYQVEKLRAMVNDRYPNAKTGLRIAP
jgi:hypothetical protein